MVSDMMINDDEDKIRKFYLFEYHEKRNEVTLSLRVNIEKLKEEKNTIFQREMSGRRKFPASSKQNAHGFSIQPLSLYSPTRKILMNSFLFSNFFHQLIQHKRVSINY